mgnify:CR=1 FL=1|tara:strand:- start:1083 stop:1247 length:165 start_codon:yes stop_codon:yes gene_type:complete
MDPDDCPHNEGTYHDKEDYTFPDVQRCNLCDVVMNYSEKEYNDDLGEDLSDDEF